MTVLQDLEKVLLTEIAVDCGKKTLDTDEDLLEQGVVDSMGILRLIVWLEKTYGIHVLDEDVVPENFQSLNSMAKFLDQKMRIK